MKVLAIDTSANTASAAVMEDDLLLGEYILNHKKTHSQKIMPMIDALLTDLELTPQDIDIYAAAVGPGSFTGLRIGVATVKALAHAAKKPTVSVGTLEALAYNVPLTEHMIVPVIDARRENVYAAKYAWDGTLKEISAPKGITIEECIADCDDLPPAIFLGDGAAAHRGYIQNKLGARALFPHGAAMNLRASSVAAAAMDKAKRGDTQTYIEMNPRYIKKSQAEKDLERKEENK